MSARRLAWSPRSPSPGQPDSPLAHLRHCALALGGLPPAPCGSHTAGTISGNRYCLALSAASKVALQRCYHLNCVTGDNMPESKPAENVQTISRDRLAELLNEDLSREYQAIIAYVVYSQVLKGAEYMSIADQLEIHAGQELQHALTLSRQID